MEPIKVLHMRVFYGERWGEGQKEGGDGGLRRRRRKGGGGKEESEVKESSIVIPVVPLCYSRQEDDSPREERERERQSGGGDGRGRKKKRLLPQHKYTKSFPDKTPNKIQLDHHPCNLPDR